ncbi:MAG: NTP transferase domain-containing protein [Desulfobacterales bacterium]|nr:NTP transferase domain-containing protein [Desulfobacterales bacterium]
MEKLTMELTGFGAVILAAGKGTRMKSDLAKVLHKVGDRSMVMRVLDSIASLVPDYLYVVVGHQAEQVKAEVAAHRSGVVFARQEALLGTGDAVKAALPKLARAVSHVLVLCGDIPLIRPQTLATLMEAHKTAENAVTVLGVELENPLGYGRLIQDRQGALLGIREQADATEEEKKIRQVNTGIYCFEKSFLEQGIKKLNPENNQAEYYLTDLIAIAVESGLKTGCITLDDPVQVMGVNTLEELEKAALSIR